MLEYKEIKKTLSNALSNTAVDLFLPWMNLWKI